MIRLKYLVKSLPLTITSLRLSEFNNERCINVNKNAIASIEEDLIRVNTSTGQDDYENIYRVIVGNVEYVTNELPDELKTNLTFINS